MKSDRELLELAAKAYGDDSIRKSPFGFERVIGYSEEMQCDVMAQWNPLTYDGDALRLAVQLRVRFERHHQPFVAAFAPDVVGRFEEPEGDDIYAATRRAIVLAAAAIGEAME